MARSIINKEKFEFNDEYRKYTGEFLNDITRGLYLSIPNIGFASAILFLLTSLAGFGGVSEVFFILTIFFFLLSITFTYMMIEERADVVKLGIINEARDTQIAHSLGLNNKKIPYYADIGFVVKEFLGKDAEGARKLNLQSNNKDYQIALNSKFYKTGYLLPGSTGSGKTVTLSSSVFLPAITSGNGFFYIEGKGDRPITESVLSFIYQHGRESDAFILDCGAAINGRYTHGLNPLAIGNPKNVRELLTTLITVMNGDNAWVTEKLLSFMGSLLIPLVLLRDMKIMVKGEDINDIESLDDFNNKEIVEFNITTLLSYLNWQSYIDLYYTMNKLLKNKTFLNKMCEIPTYQNLKNDLVETMIGMQKRNLIANGIDITSAIKPNYEEVEADIKRVNNHTASINAWISALELFGAENFYGNIFNKRKSDFDALTAIETGKIIITILPSLSAGKDLTLKMGQMITAIAKSAIGYMLEEGEITGKQKTKIKDQRYRPRKLPYAWVFDEAGNYASSDIAQMSTMVRSVGSSGGGMSVVWTSQVGSDMDVMDDGKGADKKRLLGNLGFTQCLNVQDEDYQEIMKKKCGEEWIRREELNVNKDDNKPNMRREKEAKFEVNYFQNNLRTETGECILHSKGSNMIEKGVSHFNEAPLSDHLLSVNINPFDLLKVFKSESEANRDIEAIKANINKFIDSSVDKVLNAENGLDKSFEQEVKDGLDILADTVYKALDGRCDFTLELVAEENVKAHGDYNMKTKHIRIYNAINKSRDHLIATGVHELCHHIEFLVNGNTGHSKNFYKILHEMLGYAMGIEELNFNYKEAKAKKMLDSGDIRTMERYFGVPKAVI